MVETHVAEPSEVDGSDSDAELEPVGLDTAEPNPAVPVRDEVSDPALDQGSVLPVVGNEFGILAPGSPVRSKDLIVFTDQESSAVDR